MVRQPYSVAVTNIYQQGELMQSATVRKFRTVRKEGNRMGTRNMDGLTLPQ